MSDRVCVRGCTQRDVHYATCERSGPDWQAQTGACRGCAPRECRDGSLICDRCFGRMRGLLDDAPDLLGRLRSIADPSKSTWNWDREFVGRSSSTEPPAPVGDDLLDAIHVVELVVRTWAPADMPEASNRLEAVQWLSATVLDRHAPRGDGTREAWSVQDAVDRWGVERVDRKPAVWEDDDERAEVTEPVAEWGTPIVGREDAEGIAGSAATLRRWVQKGEVEQLGETWVAGRRTRLYRRSELVAARDRMQVRQRAGLAQNRPNDQPKESA